MYTESGLLFPYYFQSFSQEAPHLQELYVSHRPNASMTSSISEYDLGEEGDLFKAPEPIIEEELLDLDPMTAAISLISCADDVISPQGLEVSDIIESSFENGQILSEVFYECKKDLLAKDGIEILPLSHVLDPTTTEAGEKMTSEENLDSHGSLLQKSASSESLNTLVDWVQETTPLTGKIFDFPRMEFSAVYGMRRSLSEGDIKTLGNGNVNLIHSPLGLCSSISEARKEKLSRYRIKKAKRNFGRKIKYACRKALADNQPRIRGRFAKTEEADASKEH
ncbi:unnamed protein product [Cuscuta epithymum]|uniref:CCT domain-containing protein n=1 Tax=Cuscuta epithymum TaxID=186058 RepID=A0AAV0FYV6_9ASTE|nr:unnamed protein product [Cuscuta epithymum]